MKNFLKWIGIVFGGLIWTDFIGVSDLVSHRYEETYTDLSKHRG